jgi:prepilin-type N-terminal cleavage/methylation domain-containing protein
MNMTTHSHKGFTLVELIVSVGLFAIVMTLAAGAYLVMISANQRTQAVATGINNLSFALESMVRSIRTGTGYVCAGALCQITSGNTFTFTNSSGQSVAYGVEGTSPNLYITRTVGGTATALTDASLVNITRLTFQVTGAPSYTSSGGTDTTQPYVTIVVSGTVSAGPKNDPQTFTIQTGAAMRGTDI